MGRQFGGWFRVYSDILNDSAIQQLSGDAFASYINLLALLNRSGSVDGVVSLSAVEARYVCRCERLAKCERLIEELVLVGLIERQGLDKDSLSTRCRGVTSG